MHRRSLYPTEIGTAIDFGCGNGRLVAEWRRAGIAGYGVDLVATESVDPDIWNDEWFESCVLWQYKTPLVVDAGNCTDVMEHIPEPYVLNTLKAITSACRHLVLKIALFPSQKYGYTLHETVRSSTWWYGQLSAIGGVTSYIEMTGTPDASAALFVWRES